MQAKAEISRPGWHRGNGEEQELILEELRALRKENENLKAASSLLQTSGNNTDLKYTFYGKPIVLHYTEKVYIFTASTVIDKKIINTTLDELFNFISLRLTGINKASDFVDAISDFQSGYRVNTQGYPNRQKNMYLALNSVYCYILA